MSGTLKPLPFADQNFDQILTKFWTLCRQMAENFPNMYCKTSENHFLAACQLHFQKADFLKLIK